MPAFQAGDNGFKSRDALCNAAVIEGWHNATFERRGPGDEKPPLSLL